MTRIMMMIMIKQKIYITLIFSMVFLSVNGQENLFKDFADSHKERAFCFYPSTLRMLNIGGNPEFNEMVSNIEKLLVYKLDSISTADKLYLDMINDFKEINYEEFVSIHGGDTYVSILGNSDRTNMSYVGIILQEDLSLALFLKGNIGWEEIPKMINSFQEEDFINILDLNLEEFD